MGGVFWKSDDFAGGLDKAGGFRHGGFKKRRGSEQDGAVSGVGGSIGSRKCNVGEEGVVEKSER